MPWEVGTEFFVSRLPRDALSEPQAPWNGAKISSMYIWIRWYCREAILTYTESSRMHKYTSQPKGWDDGNDDQYATIQKINIPYLCVQFNTLSDEGKQYKS